MNRQYKYLLATLVLAFNAGASADIGTTVSCPVLSADMFEKGNVPPENPESSALRYSITPSSEGTYGQLNISVWKPHEKGLGEWVALLGEKKLDEAKADAKLADINPGSSPDVEYEYRPKTDLSFRKCTYTFSFEGVKKDSAADGHFEKEVVLAWKPATGVTCDLQDKKMICYK